MECISIVVVIANCNQLLHIRIAYIGVRLLISNDYHELHIECPLALCK